MSKFDATTMTGVSHFWGAIRSNYLLTTEGKVIFAAKVVSLGLMQTSQIFYSLAFKLILKLKGEAGLIRFFALVSQKFPDTLRLFIEDTRKHIFEGKDREDKNSAGGFSQREIDLLTRELAL